MAKEKICSVCGEEDGVIVKSNQAFADNGQLISIQICHVCFNKYRYLGHFFNPGGIVTK
jgi:hypothetical protein